jgi:hypothetical protein
MSSSAVLLPIAQEIQIAPSDSSRRLKQELRVFEPLLGTWVCESPWTSGSPFWSSTTYCVGMNGNFLEAKTWARNAAGKTYQRYHTFWRFDRADQSITSYVFSYDGLVTTVDTQVGDQIDGTTTIASAWKSEKDRRYFRQELRLLEKDKCTWRIWSSWDGESWTQIMDGVWKRVDASQ